MRGNLSVLTSDLKNENLCGRELAGQRDRIHAWGDGKRRAQDPPRSAITSENELMYAKSAIWHEEIKLKCEQWQIQVEDHAALWI